MSKFTKFLNGIHFKVACCTVIGFLCGYGVDSAIFHINTIFAGIIEGLLLGSFGYAFFKKNGEANL